MFLPNDKLAYFIDGCTDGWMRRNSENRNFAFFDDAIASPRVYSRV